MLADANFDNPMAGIINKPKDDAFRFRARQRRLAQVARVLSGEYGQGGASATKVVLDPYGRACTDGKTVWVPQTAIEGDEAANLLAQEAILAHEAAGHLRYTDFGSWDSLRRTVANGKDDPLIHHMVNILEDTRINHLLGQDFPGSGKRVSFTNNHYTNMHRAHWATQDIDDSNRLSAVMTAIMTETINNTPHFFDDEGVVACIDEARPLYQNAINQPNTMEVIRQARRVIEVIRRHFPMGEMDREQSEAGLPMEGMEGFSMDSMDSHDKLQISESAKNQAESGEEAEDVSPTRFDERTAPTKEDAEEASKLSESESEGEGESTGGLGLGDSEDASEGDAEGTGEGADGMGSTTDDADTDGEVGEGVAGGDLDGTIGEYDETEVSGDAGNTEADDDGLAGYGGIGQNTIITSNGEMFDMETIMREAIECMEVEDYEALNDEADYEYEATEAYAGIDGVVNGPDDTGHYMNVVDFFDTRQTRSGYRLDGRVDNIEDAAEHYEATVEKYEDTIQTLVDLYTRRLLGLDTRWNTHLRRGRLDTRRLSRYGTSRNLFRKRNIQDDPTANVILLVDASGSMGGHSEGVKGGSRAHHAANASIVFHEVFHRLGFNVEVVDFSSHYDMGSVGGTQIAVNKLYSNPLCDRTKAAIALPSTGSENSDGRALNWCYNRLAEMPKDVAANMVFTISDGAPAGPAPTNVSVSQDLKNVAANPPRGVEVFALGVCGSPVDRYYEHSLSISGIDQIVDKGLFLIEDMLDRVRTNRVVQ